jgi:RNA polymerase sigma factor (sigma-70 family)
MRQADPDVRSQPRDDPDHHTPDPPTDHARPGKRQAGRPQDRIGELLGEWQRTELRIARGFAECRGLTTEQLEDIYQDTALALLARPYATEEHLRNALRHGIKHRALNMHRDTRRRSQILAEHAPSIQRVAESRESQSGPEDAALADQDRLIVREFLTELDELEQRVFWLIADGMRYRAIASALEIPVNEARNASRSCERKRQRFQLLYDTGRLCGFRSASIRALQDGELTTDELAARAFAHLAACASCRAEHKTNANRLGRTFHGQVTAFLPLPTLLGRLARVRATVHVAGRVRERSAPLIWTGGAGAKLTASAVTVAVIAGGGIGVTRALEHHATHTRRQTQAERPMSRTEVLVTKPLAPLRDTAAQHTPHHGKASRPRSTAPVAASRYQAVSRPGPAGQGAAEHEFGPESASSMPESPKQMAGHSGEEAAEREFRVPHPDARLGGLVSYRSPSDGGPSGVT